MNAAASEDAPLRFRIAKWIMDRRGLVAVAFVVATVVFAAGIRNVDIRTVFNDLLPQDDPFVQVYFDHRNFGNPLTVAIMLKRKEGDIYHAETLEKVWQLTRDIDLAPGVNHDLIISISTEKLRFAEATPFGVDTQPLMGNQPPQTAEELKEFRRRVARSPGARTFFVSTDESATLINATFHDHVDYGEAFAFAQNLVENARDDQHDVYLAGQPILTGWVYKLQKQTYSIFAVTVGGLILALIFYMRNVAGVVTPIACAAVAAVWGFGFIGWLQRPIEPLLMIVPLMLVARSFSHCVQYSERYYEILLKLGDRRKAAEVTMAIMMAPSIISILTDVCGIVFIAIAPIKAMENHAIFCGFWALWIIPTGIFLASILLSYLPVPRNIHQIVGGGDAPTGIHRVEERVLGWLSRMTQGRKARLTAAVFVAIALVSGYLNTQVKVGNPVEGSNLLWFDSEFNTAVRAINAHFPGTNTLEIVLEARDQEINKRIVNTPDNVRVSQQLQRILESDPVLPPTATLSFSDYMKETNRLFSGGNPKWQELDLTEDAILAAAFGAMLGSSALNFAHVSDFEFRNSTVSLWYPDNKQDTVDAALASARRAIDIVGVDHPEFTVRLGTGVIALQQAMNAVVERYHWLIMAMVNLAVMIIAAYSYRSLAAAVILLIPVNMANLMLVAVLYLLGIGLDVNAGIVAVIGVGVGIDYGIYLLSRICEEYTVHKHDLSAALTAALTTTGKAIMFTATIMVVGILPWHFLSDLKFMADMGILLVAVMLINMVLSLLLLPTLIWFIHPKFLARDDLLVGQTTDLSRFAPA